MKHRSLLIWALAIGMASSLAGRLFAQADVPYTYDLTQPFASQQSSTVIPAAWLTNPA
jgi:hypothetical protein